MRRLGFDVVRAADGDEALRLAAPAPGAPAPFDLILMDLKMPGLDGLEATRRLRRLEAESRSPPTPVIALTANALEDERRACKAAGFDAFLVKPFDFGDLAGGDRAPVRPGRRAAWRARPGVIKPSGEHGSALWTKQIRGDAGVALTFASRPGADGARGFLHRFSRKRDLAGLGPVLARSGALEARLATTKKDVRRAQKLRYRVFFEEGGAAPDPTARIIRRDVCRFDSVSDHLIVVDRTLRHRDGSPRFVGVYRLLRQDVAERNFGFYSALEFDVEALIARRPTTRFLEVGRACIAPTHRGRHVLELLWRGLWAYARHHNMDAMIGCASLPGADPALHAGAIRALAAGGGDPSWRVAPRPPLRRRARRGLAPRRRPTRAR